MHFEVVGNQAQIEALAASLSGTPTPVPPAPPAGKSETIKAGTWNVRSAPNMSGAIIGQAVGGQSYGTSDAGGGWRKITFNGRTGYVGPLAWGGSSPAPAPKPTEVVKKGTWNVRTGPGMGYGTIGVVQGGQRYQTTKVAGNWRQISFNGRTGYVGPAAW
jgi:uncharacterized protein YgiM (DUF1202 family)